MAPSGDAAMATGKPAFSPLETYLRYGLAGATCATTAHTVLVPMDVVKTRLQSNPGKYNGMLDGFKQIARAEGSSALLLGLAPTFWGYVLQGGCKFGFFEIFKKTASTVIDNPEITSRFKMPIYMVSSALAETIATVALCPFEAVRIKLVTQPGFASGMFSGMSKIHGLEGTFGLFKGLVPILMKQVPYTVVQLTTFQLTTDFAYNRFLPRVTGKSKDELPLSIKLSTTVASGAFAGAVSALASHPADTVLTRLNMAEGNTLMGVIRSLGWKGLWYGAGARTFMVALLSTGMFLINDSVKVAFGLPISATLDHVKKPVLASATA